MLRFVPSSSGEDSLEAYSLDRENSALTGTVLASDPEHIFWNIHLEWLNKEELEPAFRCIWAEITGLDFQANDWRSLAGKETRVLYSAREIYPILPDNPANIYLFGEHQTPNNNRVQIISRQGHDFTVAWRFNLDVPNPTEVVIEIEESVPFASIAVVFEAESEVSIQEAKRIANRFAKPAIMGDPSVTWGWVRFPIVG